ncbi:hypothetical protein [Crocosphaera chwakensis]|uniref:Uncharacterized protein n=1 Tax=Crocosphaera chwakensis CCY0110 TaxID=391612 RepID=A3IZ07_9CHRO|nr:hypothetical protein [Crocosphaera chwakensis]EAZ88308.1 hypothetical protein CY0110_14420 [Crocosphaera chwakensis CCY0110]
MLTKFIKLLKFLKLTISDLNRDPGLVTVIPYGEKKLPNIEKRDQKLDKLRLLEINTENFKEGYLIDEAPELNAKTTFGWIYDPKESKTRIKFFMTEVKNLDE